MAVTAENIVNVQLEQWLKEFGQALSDGKIDTAAKMLRQ